MGEEEVVGSMMAISFLEKAFALLIRAFHLSLFKPRTTATLA
jgi:hypothetical protein